MDQALSTGVFMRKWRREAALYRFIGERKTKGNQCKSKRWVRVTRGRTGGCHQDRVTRRWIFY
jgi:hypothetical protein